LIIVLTFNFIETIMVTWNIRSCINWYYINFDAKLYFLSIFKIINKLDSIRYWYFAGRLWCQVCPTNVLVFRTTTRWHVPEMEEQVNRPTSIYWLISFSPQLNFDSTDCHNVVWVSWPLRTYVFFLVSHTDRHLQLAFFRIYIMQIYVSSRPCVDCFLNSIFW